MVSFFLSVLADFLQRFVNFTHNQFEHFNIKYDAQSFNL